MPWDMLTNRPGTNRVIGVTMPARMKPLSTRDGDHQDGRAGKHHMVDGDPAAEPAGDPVAEAIASGEQQEIKAVFRRRPAQVIHHQEGGARRQAEERAGGQAGLQHVGHEQRPLQQLAEAAQDGRSLGGAFVAPVGLVQRDIGCHENDDAGREGESEDGAPAQGIGQETAERRRDHRPQRVSHGEIGDRLDQPFRAVGVARDGACQGDAAAGADRLDQSAENEQFDGGCQGGQGDADQEQHKSGEQHRAAAVAIGQRAIDQGGEGHGQQGDAESELRQRVGNAERRLDLRHRGQEQVNRKRTDQRDRGERNGKQRAGRLGHVTGKGGI